MITLLIDGNYLLHRCMRVPGVSELTTSKGKLTGGLFAAVKAIHNAVYECKPTKAFLVFDSGISERRRLLYPPYKGARYRDKDDPLYQEMDEELKEYLQKFRTQRILLQHISSMLAIKEVRLTHPFGRWEADDVIKAFCDCLDGVVYVMSDDKDMLQLVRDTEEKSVRNIRPIAGQVVTDENFEDIVGYQQSEYYLRKSLSGDSSDQIPNPTGVGAKTVSTVFAEECPVGEYPYSEFFEWCACHPSKRVNKIAEQKDVVLRNYELINLWEEDVSSIYPYIDEVVSTRQQVDLVGVKRYFTALELVSLTVKLHSWIMPFQGLR